MRAASKADETALRNRQGHAVRKMGLAHGAALEAMARADNDAMEALLAAQAAAGAEQAKAHSHLRHVQLEKMQALPLADRSPEEVAQLREHQEAEVAEQREADRAAGEGVVRAQLAEMEAASEAQAAEVAALADLHAAQIEALQPHTDAEKADAAMAAAVESTWDAQRTQRVLLLSEQRDASARAGAECAERRRRWYTPLGIDDGDARRGFFLPRGGELRRDVRAQRHARAQGRRIYALHLAQERLDVQDELDSAAAARELARGDAADRVREREARRRMDGEEAAMRLYLRHLLEERARLAAERERERRELERMRYEEKYGRWVAAEIERLEEEERLRLEEEAAERAEAARMKKRMARRGRGQKGGDSGRGLGKKHKKRKTKPAAPMPEMPSFDDDEGGGGTGPGEGTAKKLLGALAGLGGS
jgi:hypothetical protein